MLPVRVTLRNPDEPSSEAAHVALLFANVAWNELKLNDIDAMIDELVEYKKAHFPNDRRRILICGGTPHSTIHVEWLPPAGPGVDAKWEMRLYGMVRTGQDKEAVRFLQKTRGMSRSDAQMKVATTRMQLGMM